MPGLLGGNRVLTVFEGDRTCPSVGSTDELLPCRVPPSLRRGRAQGTSSVEEFAGLCAAQSSRASRQALASAFLQGPSASSSAAAPAASAPQPAGAAETVGRWWRKLALSGGDAAAGAAEGHAEEGAAAPGEAESAHRVGQLRLNDLALFAGFLGASAVVGLSFKWLMTPAPLSRAPPRRGNEQMTVSQPDASSASALTIETREYPEDKIVILADRGHNPAAAERLARNIMKVDGCEYAAATKKVAEIDSFHRKAVQRIVLTYFLGIGMASFSAFACFPLVYSQGLAEFVGLRIVSTDVPEPLEVHNMWKVSNWSWGWMEPATGVASFAILMWQLKNQWGDEIGLMDTYRTGKLRSVNGDGLTVVRKYKQYDPNLLKTFVLTSVQHDEPMLED